MYFIKADHLAAEIVEVFSYLIKRTASNEGVVCLNIKGFACEDIPVI